LIVFDNGARLGGDGIEATGLDGDDGTGDVVGGVAFVEA